MQTDESETNATEGTDTGDTGDAGDGRAKVGPFLEAMGRLLAHVSPHGEVYDGASSDLALIRQTLDEIRASVDG